MSIPGAANPLLLRTAAAGGYSISRSLRFNSSDSGYLSRTPASAGNRKTWTWAGWVKRSALGSSQTIFAAVQDGNNGTVLNFTSADQIQLFNYVGGAYTGRRTTAAVYRDPSAWYHILFVWDSANGTTANRIRLYVNGAEVTNFSTTGDPSSSDSIVNSTNAHYIGADVGFNNQYSNQYLADIHFIDGQALTPSSFGEFDTNGIWQPKAYTGTYGTNGFRLPFSDNSAATATALGKDTSGNGNNWTPNNLSVTAGAGNDSLVDSPTNGTASSGGDAGGVVVGNYATLNPLLSSGGAGTLTNGNLDASYSSGGWYSRVGTIYVSSGKYYWEHTVTSGSSSRYVFTGIVTPAYNGADFPGGGAGNSYAWYGNEGNLRPTAQSGWNVTYDNGDVIGVALDMDNGKLFFSKNGTWVNSSNPANGTNPQVTGLSGYSWAPAVSYYTGYGGTLNTGARPFSFAAPAGYRSLNTANLPTPTILKGSDYFDTKLYTGNGSTQTISGLGFSPDFVWLKCRNTSFSHTLHDTIRGVQLEIYSDSTSQEYSSPNGLQSFNSDGFTLGSQNYYNGSGNTFAAWCWDAGSSNATNTQGSITSTVRANASAGFSICTMTTPSSGGFSFGHGLGVAPQLVFFKYRNVSSNWYTYHQAIGQKYILLNGTGAAATNEFTTAPSSTLFTYPASLVVGPSEPLVAYCFAPVSGYSSFGSYVGNGSSDGVFVYTGFRPKYLLVKSSTSVTDWIVEDASRSPYNQMDQRLYPNDSGAEASNGNGNMDFLSNGFKLRNAHSAMNASSQTYVYACFSENPFSIARAR